MTELLCETTLKEPRCCPGWCRGEVMPVRGQPETQLLGPEVGVQSRRASCNFETPQSSNYSSMMHTKACTRVALLVCSAADSNPWPTPEPFAGDWYSGTGAPVRRQTSIPSCYFHAFDAVGNHSFPYRCDCSSVGRPCAGGCALATT